MNQLGDLRAELEVLLVRDEIATDKGLGHSDRGTAANESGGKSA